MSKRELWRNIGILGMVFGISAGFAFAAGGTIFDFGTPFFTRVLQGEAPHIMEKKSHWEYPLLSFASVIVFMSPGFLAMLLVCMLQKALLPDEYMMTHQAMYLFTATGTVFWLLQGVMWQYTEMQAGTVEQENLALQIFIASSFYYIMITFVLLLILGIAVHSAKMLPRAFSKGVILASALGLWGHFFAADPSLPVARVSMGIPFMSIIAVSISTYMWIASSAMPFSDTATLKKEIREQ